MDLVIDTVGNVRLIYSEAIDLRALGRTTITRASHVEPGPDGRWHADLVPVSGPILGPFDRRSQALEAEIAWLSAQLLTRSI